MDFGTIERKLMSSNPAKPDLNSANPRYTSADEFIADVRLVFNNCYTFNGPEHVVSLMGKRLEDIFNKQIKHMPANEEPKFLAPKQPSPTNVAPSPPSPVTQKKPTRRPSAANLPAIRRSEPSENNPLARPKREIHPPPPKDLPYADLPSKKGKGKGKGKKPKDDGTHEQFRYCLKILNDLYKKQHSAYAGFFYDPVDERAVPDYYKVIKKPMDFSTMKKRLDNKEYQTPQHFYQDFKLMIRNCFTYNPPGTVVYNAGAELQKVFEEKWKGLPPLREPSPEPEDDDVDSDDEHAQAIAIMEEQLETMRDSITALKQKKPKKDKSGKLLKSSSGSSKLSKPKHLNGSSSKVHRPSDAHVNGGSKKSSKKQARG
jgi:bromodomain-containing factor 1